MMLSSIIGAVAFASCVYASSQETYKVATVYSDFSSVPNYGSECDSCMGCLKAINAGSGSTSMSTSTKNLLNQFIMAYNSHYAARGNSTPVFVNNYSIFSSNPWDENSFLYGFTNGWKQYSSDGPIIDGSEPTVGATYSWLNGQLFQVHLDHVENAGSSETKAMLWTRNRQSVDKVYANSAVRTKYCTLWFMDSGVYSAQPEGLVHTLRAFNCSKWADLLTNTQCNGKQAYQLYTGGSVFALPDTVFDKANFSIGSWGYNNGKNDSEAWCNLLNYYYSELPVLVQNSSQTSSVNSHYFANGSVQTIDYNIDMDYNVNKTGGADASLVFNGNSPSEYYNVPLWLNNQNGSTLIVLARPMDPTKKENPPPKPKPSKNDTNTTNNDSGAESTSTSNTVLFFAIIAALFTAL
jgi:hypothetical protein